MVPNIDADKGIQEFVYSFYVWNGSFDKCLVEREAYELNTKPVVMFGEGKEKSFFKITEKNIILDSIKIAEDDSGDLILRLYEARNSSLKCNISTCFSLISVYECNMLEEKVKNIQIVDEHNIVLSFKPFEIKTLRLR